MAMSILCMRRMLSGTPQQETPLLTHNNVTYPTLESALHLQVSGAIHANTYR